MMLFALGAFCFSARCPIAVGHDSYGVMAGYGRPSLIFRIRELIDSIPFEHPETAPLLRALMTGDRSGLDRQTASAFRRSGASHLLALSGLHLGIIAMFFKYLLMILERSRPAEIVRSVLLVSFCLAYTIACGASPSLVRALLFIILQQIAVLSPNRRSTSADRLCIAATIQLALDPGAISSVAFQLSYLAMLGVVFIAPRLEAWYPSTRLSEHLDPLRYIWKAASLAISCQLTTAPLVWFRFGNFPQYFLLTNLLAMPVCELLLPVGIVTIVISSAAGESPVFLLKATDFLSNLTLEILKTISEL